MSWYERLTALGLRRSYSLKLLLVAFFGIHVPLIVLLVYLIASHQLHGQAWIVAFVVLAATLGGTAATLFIQYQLLEPIRLAEKALASYQTARVLPTLPVGYTDEAGLLMSRVQSSLAQLDEMVAEKERIMASLAQDLRSPLSSIVSAVQLVVESEPNPDNRALLETIKDTAARELTQIDDVLLAVRIDTNQLELRKTLVDVASILNEVRRFTQLTARERSINLRIESPEKQAYVNADRARIIQALNNLVLHALKTTAVNGETGLKTDISKESCCFILQHVSTGSETGVVSLGLRISNQLVRLHGSEVRIEEAGLETRISFCLSST